MEIQQPDPNSWQYKLDQFAKKNQQELAALVWGLTLEWGEEKNTLGIDLKPKPHFVACSKKAIDELNNNVREYLQEIVGIIENNNPEKEIVIIGIGEGKIKLINLETNPPPPLCFEQMTTDIDSLIESLEAKLIQYLGN
jgi:SNF2 family DNA or RNA helicase